MKEHKKNLQSREIKCDCLDCKRKMEAMSSILLVSEQLLEKKQCKSHGIGMIARIIAHRIA